MADKIMNGGTMPVEVVLVNQVVANRDYRKVMVTLLTSAAVLLLGGAGLMWLAPLLGDTFGIPRRAVGLTRLVHRSAFASLNSRSRYAQ